MVAEYSGLTYVGYSTHITEKEANAKACDIGNEVGKHAKVYPPRKKAEDNHGVTSLSIIADTSLFGASSAGVQALLDQTEAALVRNISSGGGGDFGGGGATSGWDPGSSDSSFSSSDSGSSSSFE